MVAFVTIAALLQEAPTPVSDFCRDVRPLLETHCFPCHGPGTKKAGLDFSLAEDARGARRLGSTFTRAIRQLEARKMPPPPGSAIAPSRPPPTDEERSRLIAGLEQVLTHPDPGELLDPGRVTLRRLTRYEYDRTVLDLLGVSYDSTATFPADPIAYGFDNVGDVMSVAPMLFEKYADAAREISGALLATETLRANLLAPAFRRGGRLDRAAAQEILAPLLERAFRRPVTEEELESRLLLFDRELAAGRCATAALDAALRSILLSPSFLFRIEEGEPAGAAAAMDGIPGVRRLTDFEVATRLSYFLWSTMPDDGLFELARAGRLHEPEVLKQQVHRMLQDRRSRALVDHFAAQWLRFGEVLSVAVDIRRFPIYFQLGLRDAFYAETATFFEALVREERSLLELLDCDSTFLDERLAQFYGVKDVGPGPMRRVALADPRRGGLLGMGSILTITSYPLRTSPVLRGKWILETLLDDPPPPPPADVPALPKDDRQGDQVTLRARLEKHRADPGCASCHTRMDPFGLALERFDAVGGWRELHEEQPIDDRVTLPDGTTLSGPEGVKAWLLAHQGDFLRTFARRMLTYAIGRPMEFLDEPLVGDLVAGLDANGWRFSTLVEGIVTSRPFLYGRLGHGPEDHGPVEQER